jgi:hypothetical protein
MREAGLRPAELYLTALVVLLVAAIAAAMLLVLWSEAVSVVHLGD